MISNTGDYGHFAGTVAGRQLRAGALRRLVRLPADRRARTATRCAASFTPALRTQTPWIAVRSTGAPHLKAPTEITTRGHHGPFRFAFPDLDGRDGDGADPRFRGKVRAGGHLRELVPDLPRRRAGAGAALPEVSRARARDRGPGLRGHRRHGGGRPAGAALPRQVRHPLPAAAGGHQRHRGRRRDAAAASRLHVVPDHGLPRPRRAGAPGARRASTARPRARSTSG